MSLFLIIASFFIWSIIVELSSIESISQSKSFGNEFNLISSSSSSNSYFEFPPLYVDLVFAGPYFIRFLILFILSLLQSNFVMPTKLKVSATRFDLIQWSKGESSGFKLGERLISRSQGFKSLSIKMSNPKSSKQLVQ